MSFEPEEGDQCPECRAGNMSFPPVENCSCHIAPPCHACTNRLLTCNTCGWEFEPPKPKASWRSVAPGIFASHIHRPSKDLGNGKRIFDYSYDSSSGSTMHYTGRCTPEVTPQDILDYFESGTFGHRGPTISNGRFSFTKITD